jgi:hypothetical protein
VLLIFVTGTAEAAWEDPVYKNATPSIRPNYSEMTVHEPPPVVYEMPQWITDAVKDAIASMTGAPIDNITLDQSVGTQYEENMLFFTNYGDFAWWNATGEVTQINQYIKPNLSAEEAYNIMIEEFRKAGVDNETYELHRFGADLEYRHMGDLNYHPYSYRSNMVYFIRSESTLGTVYESWRIGINTTNGELLYLQKNDEATMRNVRTSENAARVIESEFPGEWHDTPGLAFHYPPAGTAWWAASGDGNTRYSIQDDGTIERWAAPTLDSGGSSSFETEKVTKNNETIPLPFTSIAIATFIIMVFVTLFVLRKKR